MTLKIETEIVGSTPLCTPKILHNTHETVNIHTANHRVIQWIVKYLGCWQLLSLNFVWMESVRMGKNVVRFHKIPS